MLFFYASFLKIKISNKKNMHFIEKKMYFVDYKIIYSKFDIIKYPKNLLT